MQLYGNNQARSQDEHYKQHIVEAQSRLLRFRYRYGASRIHAVFQTFIYPMKRHTLARHSQAFFSFVPGKVLWFQIPLPPCLEGLGVGTKHTNCEEKILVFAIEVTVLSSSGAMARGACKSTCLQPETLSVSRTIQLADLIGKIWFSLHRQ